MKLYHYDHCPYCVKARMIFGLKDVPLVLEALLNDDEKTPIDLTGVKMVPILIREDGEPMNESLDIIEYIDNLKEFGEPIIQASRDNQIFNQWLQDARKYLYFLAMPRWVIIELPEFETKESIDYFVRKKMNHIGDFGEALKNSEKYIALAREHLPKLSRMIQGEEFFWGDPTIDDFHVFSTLRSLTVVKGLELPTNLEKYVTNMAKASKINLYTESAI